MEPSTEWTPLSTEETLPPAEGSPAEKTQLPDPTGFILDDGTLTRKEQYSLSFSAFQLQVMISF
jgi:hypothetical protein